MKHDTITMKISIILCVIMALSILSPAYAEYKGFPDGQCTEFAARRFDEVAPSPGINWNGDAYEWAYNADKENWVIIMWERAKNIPQGSIIVWKDCGHGAGHVAVVDGINNEGVFISEGNWPWGSSQSTFLTYEQLKNRRSDQGLCRFIGYILPQKQRTKYRESGRGPLK